MPKITLDETLLLLQIFYRKDVGLQKQRIVSCEEYHKISLIPRFQQLFDEISTAKDGYSLSLRKEAFEFLSNEVNREL